MFISVPHCSPPLPFYITRKGTMSNVPTRETLKDVMQRLRGAANSSQEYNDDAAAVVLFGNAPSRLSPRTGVPPAAIPFGILGGTLGSKSGNPHAGKSLSSILQESRRNDDRKKRSRTTGNGNDAHALDEEIENISDGETSQLCCNPSRASRLAPPIEKVTAASVMTAEDLVDRLVGANPPPLMPPRTSGDSAQKSRQRPSGSFTAPTVRDIRSLLNSGTTSHVPVSAADIGADVDRLIQLHHTHSPEEEKRKQQRMLEVLDAQCPAEGKECFVPSRVSGRGSTHSVQNPTAYAVADRYHKAHDEFRSGAADVELRGVIKSIDIAFGLACCVLQVSFVSLHIVSALSRLRPSDSEQSHVFVGMQHQTFRELQLSLGVHIELGGPLFVVGSIPAMGPLPVILAGLCVRAGDGSATSGVGGGARFVYDPLLRPTGGALVGGNGQHPVKGSDAAAAPLRRVAAEFPCGPSSDWFVPNALITSLMDIRITQLSLRQPAHSHTMDFDAEIEEAE